MRLLQVVAAILSFAFVNAHAFPGNTQVINKIVIFGDSLSDNGNTGHLLKSINQHENPNYLITPFQVFIIEKMRNFAEYYRIPSAMTEKGVEEVGDFFEHDFAPVLASLLASVREVPIIPDEPYWQWHFSNGPVWNEYLAPMMGIDTTNSETYTNQAFGGSWAASYDYKLTVWNLIRHPLLSIKNLIAGKLIPPSLGITVQTYLLNQKKLDKQTVFFLLSGGNDYLNLLNFVSKPNDVLSKNFIPDLQFIDGYVLNVIDSIHAAYLRLVEKGGENFVIMGLPLIGDVPMFSANIAERNVINLATQMHNKKLRLAVEQWQKENKSSSLLYIDLEEFLDEAKKNPKAFDLTNTVDACIDIKLPMLMPAPLFNQNVVLKHSLLTMLKGKNQIPKTAAHHACEHPEHYMYWDEIHPTTQMHKLLARTICDALFKAGYPVNCYN